MSTSSDSVSSSSEDQCNVCLEEKHTFSLCGNSKCAARVCEDCAATIWNKVRHGILLTHADFLCSFCKQPPVKSLNLRINEALELFKTPGVICAVCTRCNKIKFHSQEGCNIRTNADLTKFVCEECLTSEVIKKCANCKTPTKKTNDLIRCNTCSEYWCFKCGEFHSSDKKSAKTHVDECIIGQIKACPGCGMMTNKTFGCNHMTCRTCHVHWCWKCGEFRSNESAAVYTHTGECEGIINEVVQPVDVLPNLRRDATLINNRLLFQCFIIVIWSGILSVWIINCVSAYSIKDIKSSCDVTHTSHNITDCCVPDWCIEVDFCYLHCNETSCCKRDVKTFGYQYYTCTSGCTTCDQYVHTINGEYTQHSELITFTTTITCNDFDCNSRWDDCNTCKCFYDPIQNTVSQTRANKIDRIMMPIITSFFAPSYILYWFTLFKLIRDRRRIRRQIRAAIV